VIQKGINRPAGDPGSTRCTNGAGEMAITPTSASPRSWCDPERTFIAVDVRRTQGPLLGGGPFWARGSFPVFRTGAGCAGLVGTGPSGPGPRKPGGFRETGNVYGTPPGGSPGTGVRENVKGGLTDPVGVTGPVPRNPRFFTGGTRFF